MNRALTVVIAAAAIILSGLVAGPAAALPPGCTPTFPDAPSQSVVEAGDPAIFTIPGPVSLGTSHLRLSRATRTP